MMKELWWTVAVACAASACSKSDASREEQQHSSIGTLAKDIDERCPDPPNCTLHNGIGIYADEGGSVQMGDLHLMIQHFINERERVFFIGTYLHPTAGWIENGVGYVESADHHSKNSQVLHVAETNTLPAWTLDNQDYTPTEPLTLHLVLFVPTKTLFDLKTIRAGSILSELYTRHRYALEITYKGQNPDDGKHDRTGAASEAVQFDARWRDESSSSGVLLPYCRAKSPLTFVGPPRLGPKDTVVFQSGFDMSPRSGQLTLAPEHVTMSCALGAPAIVHDWGYPYPLGTAGAADRDYFQAAIHMKRAAYCGDERYFTVDGLEIDVTDNSTTTKVKKVADLSAFNVDPRLEAVWTPKGAKCVNLTQRRYRKSDPKLIFDGVCHPGKTLDACGTASQVMTTDPVVEDRIPMDAPQ